MLQLQNCARSVWRALPSSSGIEGGRLQLYIADPAGRLTSFFSRYELADLHDAGPMTHSICRRDAGVLPETLKQGPPCLKVLQSYIIYITLYRYSLYTHKILLI